jgi:CheY-like chemotaxis protein
MVAMLAESEERRRPLILVAEDFSDARELYKELFELEGYDVILAADGAEALRIAQDRDPDVVIMDLSMPVLDGVGAAMALKSDAKTRHIPIVALTGHVLPQHQSQAREAGCDTVVSKPCVPSALADKIRSMLHASKPRD